MNSNHGPGTADEVWGTAETKKANKGTNDDKNIKTHARSDNKNEHEHDMKSSDDNDDNSNSANFNTHHSIIKNKNKRYIKTYNNDPSITTSLSTYTKFYV